nr:MAG TPA: hypothetical protein [Caudoviricetes sp.]
MLSERHNSVQFDFNCVNANKQRFYAGLSGFLQI